MSRSFFNLFFKKERKRAAPKGAASFLGTGVDLSSQAVSRQVLSTRMSLTSVFGMGTGGTSSSLTPAIYLKHLSAIHSFGDPCGTRTRVAGVRGQSLNRLTNGPGWCTIRDSNPGPAD